MSRFNAFQIKFDKDYLNELTKDSNSGVYKQNCKHHIALHPSQFANFGQSIKDELGRKIGKYDDGFQGIMLGYQNIKLQSDLGVIGLDNCYVHIDIQADFFLFRPEIGMVLKGIVTRTTKGHVGCLVYNTFNISLPKPDDDDNDDGWLGNQASIKSEVEFRIIYVDLNARLPYIRGQLLSVLNNDESVLPVSQKKGKKPNKKIKFEENNEEDSSPKESKKKHKKKHNTKADENLEQSLWEAEEENATETPKKKHKNNHNKSLENSGIQDEDIRKYEENDISLESKKKHKKKHSKETDKLMESLEVKEEKLSQSEEDNNTPESKKKHRKSHNMEDSELFNSIQIKVEETKEYEEDSITEKSKKKRKKNLNSEIDKTLQNLKIEEDDSGEQSLTKKMKKHKKDKHKFDYDEQNEDIVKKKEKRREKKIKQEQNEMNISLESLDIKSLFDDSSTSKNTHFFQNHTMANSEDKGKRRKSNSVSQELYLDNIKLEEDSELEKIISGKKRKSEDMPPLPPNKSQTVELDVPSDEDNDGEDMKVDNEDLEFLPSSSVLHDPHLIKQQELNDLIRDLNL